MNPINFQRFKKKSLILLCQIIQYNHVYKLRYVKFKKLYKIYLKICFANLLKEKTMRNHIGSISCLIKLNQKYIMSAGADCSIKIWNLKSGCCNKTLTGHKEDVNCLLKLNNIIVASAGADKTIRVWNVNKGNNLITIDAHNSSIWSLSKINIENVVSGSSDRIIKL